ncbi:Hydroxypyruvate reductase [Mycobacterium talmoniae]|uniref:Hydroxypyruvate reductase n=1 Tax=Mycobacterium talmoniae TaxID=1858794 RepID=A0A2S8BSS6_9MYCO|nr:Hydroxypyruvate reductase [Mycobacterium talmoniae]
MTVALLLAATRHLLVADADVRAGETFRDGTLPYQRFRAWEIAGATAGLIGLGAVGRALRWRLTGLGLRVIAYDPTTTRRATASTRCSPNPTSCRCTRGHRRTPSG